MLSTVPFIISFGSGLHTGQYGSPKSRRQTCPHSGQHTHLSVCSLHTGHSSIYLIISFNCQRGYGELLLILVSIIRLRRSGGHAIFSKHKQMLVHDEEEVVEL